MPDAEWTADGSPMASDPICLSPGEGYLNEAQCGRVRKGRPQAEEVTEEALFDNKLRRFFQELH